MLLPGFSAGHVGMIHLSGLECNIHTFIPHTGVFVDVGEILKGLLNQLKHVL